jgi:hypothetical protein
MVVTVVGRGCDYTDSSVAVVVVGEGGAFFNIRDLVTFYLKLGRVPDLGGGVRGDAGVVAGVFGG